MTRGARAPALGVFVDRLTQLIGWSGVVGVAMTGCAVVVLSYAWTTRVQTASNPISIEAKVSQSIRFVQEPDLLQALPELAHASEIPLVLTQIEQIAIASGLRWSAADYRMVAATDTQPPSLEIRSMFKAPYPKVRLMLSKLFADIPSSTLREFSVSRSSIDASDVDARLMIAVLLQDSPIAPSTVIKQTAP